MPVRRRGCAVLGFAILPVGVAGVVLPLLPGTPLLIVCAWCFAKSSPRTEAWLVGHPRLGPPIRRWRERGVIPTGAKWAASAAMALSATLALVSAAPLLAKGLAVLALTAAAVFIWSRPSR